MAGIDELLATFMGQVDTSMNAPPAPWQQELLETVNPEKVKRQNIARALAKASTAMATTPGNFLSGVSAAAATGADAYLTGRDEGEQQRMKVQQLVQMQQQKDQDRRLGMLLDAIGVNRNVIQDKTAEEDRQYGRTKDERDWKLRSAESESRRKYYEQGRGSGGKEAAAERKRGTAAKVYFDWLDGFDEYSTPPTEVEKDAKWNEITRRFGLDALDEDPTQSTSPRVTDPGKTDLPKNSVAPQQAPADTGGILDAPPPADRRIKGQVYETPKGPMVWTGNGWTPAQ